MIAICASFVVSETCAPPETSMCAAESKFSEKTPVATPDWVSSVKVLIVPDPVVPVKLISTTS